MNRQKTTKRRTRVILTITILLLLQIFNEMDWNCTCRSHRRCCDPDCRAEHRTETICQPDMDTLLEAAWMQIHVESVPFYSSPVHAASLTPSDLPSLPFRSVEWNHGPPPEKPVPQRC